MPREGASASLPSLPLVAVAVGMLVGGWTAVLGWRVPGVWMASVAVLGLGGMLALSTRESPVRVSRRGLAVLGLAAALLGQGLAPPPRPTPSPPGGVARVVGMVERSGGDGALLEISGGETLDETPLPLGAHIFVRGIDAPAGSRVRVLALLSPRHAFRNPSPHPRWPGQRPIVAVGRSRSALHVLEPAPFWRRVAHAVRGHVSEALRTSLSSEASALGRTLLLGESRSLDTASRESVRGAGLSHVLAVSGLHVTLLAGACVALASLVFRRSRWLTARGDARRLAMLVGMPIALGYALLVGDAPSAWRAATTASLAWALGAAGRRAHPLGVAAGAALILAAVRPDDLARPGFALSIVATAAIVSDLGPRRDPWRAALVIAARTTCATAPIVIWLFGSLPVVGVLANVVVVPLATLVMLPAMVCHALLASASVPLSALTAPFAEASCRAFISASEVFAAVPIGRGLPPPSVPQGLLLAAACVAVLAVTRWRTRALVVALATLGLGAAEVQLRHAERPTGRVRATFLDVGQGDATLVDLPDGGLMVIDAGGAIGGGPDPGGRVIVPLLRARRRSRIDVLVISHPHPDHYGGVEALLDAFDVGEIWDSGQARVEEPEGELASLLASRGIPIREPPDLCDRVHRFGEAEITLRWPCPDYDPGWGPNENSLVLELAFGQRRFLFTGDAEAHAEAALAEMRIAPIDVLKVAHHGSRTSSSAALLAQLRPGVAIVSAGPQNRFGHPHPEVWERLDREAGCTLRTDRDGGVMVTTDGRELEITPRRCSRRSRARR